MKSPFFSTLIASFLIAGTTIGAGMLGIPLITAQLGLLPATLISLVVWLFMMGTGFLFLEATLWMPEGSNVLTITKKILGKKGRWWGGCTFAFLYYSLMIAYFAAIIPLLQGYMEGILGKPISTSLVFVGFTVLFGGLLAFGIGWVARINFLLMSGLILSCFLLMKLGFPYFSIQTESNWSLLKMGFSTPILFSAFGYHNIIPSLTFHFNKNRTLMRRAIFWGTFLPCSVYILWQWFIMGLLPVSFIQETLLAGKPITFAMSSYLQNQSLVKLGNAFAFFAILTSMLGVALSMIDFFADGLKWKRFGKDRIKLCAITLLPPAFLSAMDPKIFVVALSIAGGFGEAFLNGILPTLLVWRGKFFKKFSSSLFLIQKPILWVFYGISFAVVFAEIFFLLQYR